MNLHPLKLCFLGINRIRYSYCLPVVFGVTVGVAAVVEPRVGNLLTPVPGGDLRWEGPVGQRIDTVAQARILSEKAWSANYPETEEAFRLRQDDWDYPRKGEWRGEFWGKYMLSAIAAQKYYHSDDLKRRIAQAVDGLLSTQDENGYIGTYGRSDYAGPGTWNVWGRKYTLWALLESWELLGDPRILAAAGRFADQLIGEFGPAGKPIITTGQFYGLPSTSILKPVVLLYRATGEPKYLDFARYIVEQWTQHPAGLPDLFRHGLADQPVHQWSAVPARDWAKSYEFVSCVEGMVALYRVTGDRRLLTSAENIHRQLVEWELSPVGTISFNDKFIGSRYLLNTVAEVCDAVYWNRLSHELFLLTGKTAYLDEIERTFYNALLGSANPDGSWGLRRLRLTHEHIPAHKHFLEHHQCCVDNLPRGLFQAVESAAFVDQDGLYLALFNPAAGRVEVPGHGRVGLRVSGDFLADGRVDVALDPVQPGEFTVRIRRPFWSTRAEVAVNDRRQVDNGEGAWISVRRVWQPGDKLTITLAIPVRAEGFSPERMAASTELVAWHAQEWGSMGVKQQDPVTKKETQLKTVTPADALPHQRACVFFHGPVALARDARLGPVDFTASLKPMEGIIPGATLQSRPTPDGIWRAWRLRLATGESIDLCDFSSAGNTWDARSRFSAWYLLRE